MNRDAVRRMIEGAPERAPHRAVLMCRPDGFRIAYAINPHMRDPEGRLKIADPALARTQWEALARAYAEVGLAVEVIAGNPAFPDMVFAANQSLPFTLPDGRRAVLLSNMNAPVRCGEVPLFEAWFKSRGYEIRRLSREDAPSLEGCGDLIWHPGRRLLFGGHGFRTAAAALDHVARTSGIPVIPVRLVDPRFYHLDTCFMPLDERRALAFRGAFDPASFELLAASFDEIVEPPEDEAVHGLACNASCPDGRHVMIEASCRGAARRIAEMGFDVRPIDTSEFLKSGGSVFCMTLMLP